MKPKIKILEKLEGTATGLTSGEKFVFYKVINLRNKRTGILFYNNHKIDFTPNLLAD